MTPILNPSVFFFKDALYTVEGTTIPTQLSTSSSEVVVIPLTNDEQVVSSSTTSGGGGRKPRKGTPVKLCTAHDVSSTPSHVVVVEEKSPMGDHKPSEDTTRVNDSDTETSSSCDNNEELMSEKQIIYKRVCSTDAHQTIANKQTLLLNGKRYEIVPVGGSRWITRNEYEMMRELQALQMSTGLGNPISPDTSLGKDRHDNDREVTPGKRAHDNDNECEQTTEKRQKTAEVSNYTDLNLNIEKRPIIHELLNDHIVHVVSGEGKTFKVLKGLLNTVATTAVAAK